MVAGNFGGDFINGELAKAGDATEAAKELLRGAVADAGNFSEGSADAAAGAALAVKRDGETVRLVANLLDQVQHGRVMIERDRIILLAVNV